MREARENDMRLKAFAPIVMFVSFAFGFGAHAQQSDISAAPSPVWNDNSLIWCDPVNIFDSLGWFLHLSFRGQDQQQPRQVMAP